MTLVEQEEIERWLKRKREDKAARLCEDRWYSNDLKRDRYDLAYWFKCRGKEHRIHQTGDSIVEVVRLCQNAESRIMQG